MPDLHEVTSEILSEGRHAGEFIMSEANGVRSRVEGILTASEAAALEAGTVLALVDATGHWTEMLPDSGADFVAVSAGILLNNTPVSASTQAITVIVRDAEVNGSELEWEPSGTISGPETVAGIAELAALGIIVR
jgi:deoxyribose-phosphate aldolase